MRIVRRLYQILTTHPKVSKENVEKTKVRTIKTKKKPIEYLRLISMSQQLYGSSPETFFYIDLLKSFTRSQIIPFFSSNIC